MPENISFHVASSKMRINKKSEKCFWTNLGRNRATEGPGQVRLGWLFRIFRLGCGRGERRGRVHGQAGEEASPGQLPGLATNSIFSCFLFVKNHWFAPWRGNPFFSLPPSNSLVSVSDQRRAFWADTVPFSGPRLALCVASGSTEIQGHHQVCRARRGAPRTPSTTTDANLDCAFVENALLFIDPQSWKVNRIE